MTVEFALFLSPEGIALAHRQEAGHWALIGDTGLDVPDLGGALAELQALGEARGGTDFPTLLILPDDQILYTELDGLGGSASIPGRLEGLTPYEVADLAYDWRDLGGGRAVLAIVARETLDEAEGFAREHGFNGVGFAASPPVEKFPGVPLFQLADDAKGLGDWSRYLDTARTRTGPSARTRDRAGTGSVVTSSAGTGTLRRRYVGFSRSAGAISGRCPSARGNRRRCRDGT